MGIKVQNYDYGNQTGILFEREIGGVRHVAKPVKLKWEKVTDNGWNIEPTFTIGFMDVRDLTEKLAGLGFPTKHESAVEAELKATKIHLEDMRKLVFKAKAS